jgi:hypothetical protein
MRIARFKGRDSIVVSDATKEINHEVHQDAYSEFGNGCGVVRVAGDGADRWRYGQRIGRGSERQFDR